MEKCFTSFFKQSQKKKILIENNEVILDDAEIAKIFKNYFDKIFGNLDINQNLECLRETLKEDPILTSVGKYATYSSIKTIKSRMNDINSNFSFKFVDQDQVFKEIKKLDGNEAR